MHYFIGCGMLWRIRITMSNKFFFTWTHWGNIFWGLWNSVFGKCCVSLEQLLWLYILKLFKLIVVQLFTQKKPRHNRSQRQIFGLLLVVLEECMVFCTWTLLLALSYFPVTSISSFILFVFIIKIKVKLTFSKCYWVI